MPPLSRRASLWRWSCTCRCTCSAGAGSACAAAPPRASRSSFEPGSGGPSAVRPQPWRAAHSCHSLVGTRALAPQRALCAATETEPAAGGGGLCAGLLEAGGPVAARAYCTTRSYVASEKGAAAKHLPTTRALLSHVSRGIVRRPRDAFPAGD